MKPSLTRVVKWLLNMRQDVPVTGRHVAEEEQAPAQEGDWRAGTQIGPGNDGSATRHIGF